MQVLDVHEAPPDVTATASDVLSRARAYRDLHVEASQAVDAIDRRMLMHVCDSLLLDLVRSVRRLPSGPLPLVAARVIALVRVREVSETIRRCKAGQLPGLESLTRERLRVLAEREAHVRQDLFAAVDRA